MYFFPSLQAFTGIDDIETSIEFLNGTNWNLMVRKSLIHLKCYYSCSPHFTGSCKQSFTQSRITKC